MGVRHRPTWECMGVFDATLANGCDRDVVSSLLRALAQASKKAGKYSQGVSDKDSAKERLLALSEVEVCPIPLIHSLPCSS